METLDLKCTSYDISSMLYDAWTKYRVKKTKWFLDSRAIRPETALFIGHYNDVDKHIADYLGITYIYTMLELNDPLPEMVSKFDYVFCFDVIEHLMNPLLFLKGLKRLNCPVLITYPRHPFTPFWGHCHFHEYSERAFRTLIKTAGFKVKDRYTFSTYKEWWKFFNGFRPVLRFIFLMFGYPRHEIYTLE